MDWLFQNWIWIALAIGFFFLMEPGWCKCLRDGRLRDGPFGEEPRKR